MSEGEEELAIGQICQILAGVPGEDWSRIVQKAIQKRKKEERNPKKPKF